MKTVTLVSLPVASGLLATLAFPGVDLGFLAWFALAPFLLALRQPGPLAGAGLGFLFGCVFVGGVFRWLGTLAMMTPTRVVLMYAALALYFAVFGLLYAKAARVAGPWIVLGAPALWVGLEYARSNFSFLALPWNLLGHSQYRYLVAIQIADLTGVYGVSFLVVLANQVLSQMADRLVARKWRRPSPDLHGAGEPSWAGLFVILVVAVVPVLAYGWYSLAAPEPGERVRVALVQANVLARNNMTGREHTAHLRAYEQLTRQAAAQAPDLVVWPSSSLPAPLEFLHVSYFVSRVAQEARSYLLVGGAGGEKLGPRIDGYLAYSNSEFLLSPSGRIERQYNKIRLTPFDEYVPLQGRVRWPRWITTLEESFRAGGEYTIFEVGAARFGVPICWENSLPEVVRQFVARGANLVISVTNEGFFGPTAAPYQTLAMNVFRAIENRVTVVRAATTGVSAFISSKGEILGRVTDGAGRDLFVSGILVRDVPLATARTFYTARGDIFGQAVTILAAIIALLCLLPDRWSPWRSPCPAA